MLTAALSRHLSAEEQYLFRRGAPAVLAGGAELADREIAADQAMLQPPCGS